MSAKPKEILIEGMRPPTDDLLAAATVVFQSSETSPVPRLGNIYAAIYHAWIAGYKAAEHK